MDWFVESRSVLRTQLVIISVVLSCTAAIAAEPGELPLDSAPLIVGTKSSPPFAYRQADGSWTGISIELWERVADELNLDYEYHEAPLESLLDGLASGDLDAAVAAISVTAERHERIEFCHPHFTTGLGIATRAGGQDGLGQLIRRIVSTRLLAIVAVMLVILAVCGFLFWRLERNVNQTLFGGKRRQGIEMGVWWSTILLLGHKGVVPVSTAGRLVAGAAMVASILLLSLLTGVVTSVLTVQQLDFGIDDPGDLRQARVAAIDGSTAAEYLRRRRIGFRPMATAEIALRALSAGKTDAVVYDRPLLQYLVAKEFAETLHVLPVTFNTQEYAIALAPNSKLRKPLNSAILRYRASDLWDELIYRYLGE